MIKNKQRLMKIFGVAILCICLVAPASFLNAKENGKDKGAVYIFFADGQMQAVVLDNEQMQDVILNSEQLPIVGIANGQMQTVALENEQIPAEGIADGQMQTVALENEQISAEDIADGQMQAVTLENEQIPAEDIENEQLQVLDLAKEGSQGGELSALDEKALAGHGIFFYEEMRKEEDGSFSPENILELRDGTYVLSGDFEGQVLVNAGKKKSATLVLDNFHVENAQDAAIYCKKTASLTIILADGSQNSVTSGTPVEINEDCINLTAQAGGGAIYSKADTRIEGSGSLDVYGYINNGIQVSKSLTIAVHKNDLEHLEKNSSAQLEETSEELSVDSGTALLNEKNSDDVEDNHFGSSENKKKADETENLPNEKGNFTVNSSDLKEEITIDLEGNAVSANNTEERTNIEGNFNEIKENSEETVADGEAENRSDYNINITAANNGIKVKDAFLSESGKVKILAGGDGIKAEEEAVEAQDAIYDEDTGLLISEAVEETEAAGIILINGGDYEIDSYDDGLQALLDLQVNDGSIAVNAYGTYQTKGAYTKTRDKTFSAKGLKSAGPLSVNGGTVRINSYNDGLHSAGELSINGGVTSIYCGDDGVHSDVQIHITDGIINIANSYEGIEANQITIDGGTITLFAWDDGMNANGGAGSFGGPGGPGGPGSRGSQSKTPTDMPNLIINDGDIYVNANGDGLDSNGNISVTGGRIVVDGPTSNWNGPLDAGRENGGTIVISGGLCFAGGASGMAETFEASSKQPSFQAIISSGYSEGAQIRIFDANGEELFSHKPASGGNSIVFSCPELELGQTYLLEIEDTPYEINLTNTSTKVNLRKTK